ADSLQPELFVILRITERAARDTGDVPEEGVGIDSVLIHSLDAFRRHVSDSRYVFPSIDRLSTVGKRAVNNCNPKPRVRLAIDEPRIALLVERLELRNFVAPFRRGHAGGPGIRRFLQMIISRDDFVLHGSSPCSER